MCSSENEYHIDANSIDEIKRNEWPQIQDILDKKYSRLPTDFIKHANLEHLVADSVETEATLQLNLGPVLREVCALPHYSWL